MMEGKRTSSDNFAILVLIAVVSNLASCVFGHDDVCPLPPTYPKSELSYSDRTLGAYATYSCQNGFEMVGPSDTVILICDETGEWRSSVTPDCRPVRCPPPEIPAFGNITYLTGSGEFGSTIVYQCQQPFFLRVGPIGAKCRADGTWSRKTPICQIVCETPVTPNGIVSHLGDHVCLEFSAASEPLLAWQEAQGECQGHDGSLVIVRNSDAQEELRSLLAEVVDVDNMSTGWWWIGAEEQRSAAVQVTRGWQWVDGSLVDEVFWAPGEPTSAPDSDSRGECVDLDPTMDYQWTDHNCSLQQRYICQFGEGGICSDPGIPTNGRRTLLTCVDEGFGQFITGCLMTFRCNPGYRLVGENSMTCESNGEWSEVLPTCERKRCSTPPPAENLVETLSDLYRGTAVYQCPEGSYAAQGDAFASCQQDGTWSETGLQCTSFETASSTPTPLLEPDWTFIGVVGALGILLLIAIFVIVILAAVRNRNLNARRRQKRPLPSTIGRKRRSDDVTYYSIRQMNRYSQPETTSSPTDMPKKRLSDVGESVQMTAFKQNDATYSKDFAPGTDDGYLVPIKSENPTGRNIPPRLSSGEYENPLSPVSGTYHQVPDDEDNQSEDGLLNNYIIVLPDEEEKEEKKEVVAMTKLNEIKVETEEPTDMTSGNADETVGDGGAVNDEERAGVTEERGELEQNGLQVPALSYSKEDFGSTVEL